MQRPAFARALLESQVFVLGHTLGDVRDGVAQAGASVRLVTLDDAEGPVTPFFTSEGALQDTLSRRPGTDPQYLRFACRALFEMTAGSRLVLNPDSAHGKLFISTEIAALLAGEQVGVQTETLAADRQVMVGAPAHVPPALPTVLARFFASRPVVEAAHLGWIAHPDGHHGFLLVVTATNRDQAMADFGTRQIGELTDGAMLDAMVVPTPAQNPLANVVAPIYTRSQTSS